MVVVLGLFSFDCFCGLDYFSIRFRHFSGGYEIMSKTQFFFALLTVATAALLTWHDSWTCAAALIAACASFICVTLIEQRADDRFTKIAAEFKLMSDRVEALMLNKSFR